jgi:hypothetical protein
VSGGTDEEVHPGHVHAGVATDQRLQGVTRRYLYLDTGQSDPTPHSSGHYDGSVAPPL